MRDKKEYDALVVVTPKDFERVKSQHSRLIEYLPVRRLYFVGNDEVGTLVDESQFSDSTGFINENDIIPYSEVHDAIEKLLQKEYGIKELKKGAAGWYYQQFLKMEYAKQCKDEYYMVWDGDTIPCRSFSMFSYENKPYFDLKTEFNRAYFETISILFPGMNKCIRKSFIAEHMLINKKIMLQLISDIEKNDSILGEIYYEKIINAVGPNRIQGAGFSEFETYGTYVAYNYSDHYKLRNWHSFRYAGEFFNINTIDDTDYEWLSADFNAVSFEKEHVVSEGRKNLFDNKEYQMNISARQLLEIIQEEFGDGSYQEVWD